MGTPFGLGISVDKEPSDLRNSSGHSSTGFEDNSTADAPHNDLGFAFGKSQSRGSRTAWLPRSGIVLHEPPSCQKYIHPLIHGNLGPCPEGPSTLVSETLPP